MSKQPFENVVHYLFQIAARAEFKTLHDHELLKRYVEQRDELAFGELVRRYKEMIWHVCWRVLRHHQEVEDAFQATIMTMVRRGKTILDRETVEGWLHRVAYHIATKAKVAQARRHAREVRRAEMWRESIPSDHRNRELAEVIDKELIHIPEKLRCPLILCYLEGFTQNQAAQKLGISIDALDCRLRRGRERLKKRLSKYGMELGPTMLMTDMNPAGVPMPEVPAGLVERTLDMVRIMTLSNGALEATGVSAEVATLVKGAMGIGTLKAKILLGLLLSALLVAGGGMVTYRGWLNFQGDQPKEKKIDRDNKTPEEELSKEDKVPLRTDCYGDPLPPRALHRMGTVRSRPACWGESSNVVAFTPDGKSLLTVGKFLYLWDMKTGRPLRRFGDEGFRYAELSPDGKLVVGISNDLYVWETATGKLVRQWKTPGSQNALWSCAFSPDSQALAARLSDDVKDMKTGKVVGQEQKLCLWDIATGQRYWQQKVQQQATGDDAPVAFSLDGTLVADGGAAGICLHDARTGQFLRRLGQPWPVKSIAFAPDSHTLLVLYDRHEQMESSAYLWDVTTGKKRWHLDKQNAGYGSMAFSPDGMIVAISGFWANTISLLEAATGKERLCCQHDRSHHWDGSIAFSPDGKILASTYGSYSSPGVIIRCWEVTSGNILAPQPSFPGHEAAVDSVVFMPDGNTLVSGGCNQAVYLWNTRTGQQRLTLRQESRIRSLQSSLWDFTPLTEPLTVAAVSPDGKIIAGRRLEMPGRELNYNTVRVSICLWDAATGREFRTLASLPRQNTAILAQMAFSPDSKFLAACLAPDQLSSHEGRVFLYDIANGTIVHSFAGVDPTFFPDRMHLLTREDGVLNFWNLATGKKVSSITLITGKQHGARLAIAPDWQTLAFGTNEGVSLYSLYGDKPSTLRLEPSHDVAWSAQNIRSLVMSPDGKLLAATGDDLTVYVWETATGQERLRFTGHNGRIQALSFSPDGRRLVSGSEDTTILEWDLTSRLDEQGHMRPVRLSAQARTKAWELLTSSDAIQAHRVIWNLVAARSQTVSFLGQHLHPATEKQVTAADLAQLIADLGSATYAVRKCARESLEALKEIAEPSLRQALEQPSTSLEMQYTIQSLLTAVEAKRMPLPSGKLLRELRAIEILEHIGTRDACRLLAALSQGTPNIRLTREARAALRRLQQQAGGQ